MTWLGLRYRKLWYVVTLDDLGHTLTSAGPYRWPKAERLRDQQPRRFGVRCIVRRTP